MSTIDGSDKRILGFRSNKLWKKIVSVSYLCFVGIVLIAGICIQREGKITVTDFLIDKILYILLCTWFLTPYIFLSNTYLRNKLPFFKKKNFKASFLGMVIVSLVILCFLAITYAFHSSEYKADMQNHAYDIVSKTEATCETDGKVQYTCNYCGKSTEEILQAFGHSMKEVSRKEPTETKNGEIVKKCENCEKTETDIIEPTTQSSQNTTDTDAPTTTVPSTTTENKTNETTLKNEEDTLLDDKNNTQNVEAGFVVETSPYTYVFDEIEQPVGNCSIFLKKIEIVNMLHKSYGVSSTYAKYIRIQAKVKNNSSQETYLTSKKDGQFLIGKYYGTNENTNIGWNNNYKWKIDSDIKSDYGWSLKPNQTREICVTGVFIDSDRLKYTDQPKFDLYFVNDGETLTLSIN